MTATKFDPLTDPSLSGNYRQPRDAREICMERHAFHMQVAKQDIWLRKVLRENDDLRAQHERELEEDLEYFRTHGRLPSKSKKGKRS